MYRGLKIGLLILTVASFATCQMFQYSRGWTNGKRAENSVVMSVPPQSGSDADAEVGRNHQSSLQARCADIYNLKVLPRMNKNNELVCQVPCEFLDVLKECSWRFDKVGSGPDHQRLRELVGFSDE